MSLRKNEKTTSILSKVFKYSAPLSHPNNVTQMIIEKGRLINFHCPFPVSLALFNWVWLDLILGGLSLPVLYQCPINAANEPVWYQFVLWFLEFCLSSIHTPPPPLCILEKRGDDDFFFLFLVRLERLYSCGTYLNFTQPNPNEHRKNLFSILFQN